MPKRARNTTTLRQAAMLQAQAQLGNGFVLRHMVSGPAEAENLQRMMNLDPVEVEAWLEQQSGEQLMKAFLELQAEDPHRNADLMAKIRARLAQKGPHWIFLLQQMQWRVQQTTGGVRQRLRQAFHHQSYYRKRKRKRREKLHNR